MPRYLNTDNGQVLTVADHEALHYEAASNFERVDDVPEPVPEHIPEPARAPVKSKPAPKKKG